MWDKPKVLFLYAGHPERSEMAEGFMRALAKDSIQPVSAAVEPAPVDPLAVDAITRLGSTFLINRLKMFALLFRNPSPMSWDWAINLKNVALFFLLHFEFFNGAWRIPSSSKARLNSASKLSVGSATRLSLEFATWWI